MVKNKKLKRQKTNNKNFLLRNYTESFKYLKESRNFIYASIILFSCFAVIGFFVPPPDYIVEKILDFIKKILEQTEGLSNSELIVFIFLNNIKSAFIGLFAGVLFGIVPVINAVANGYVVGFVSAKAVSAQGLGSLWRLVPHGVFELPALFISLGLGLKLGSFIFSERDKVGSFKDYLISSIKVFLLIVLPLLIIAAIIEGLLINLI